MSPFRNPIKLVAIAGSTGGPLAMQEIITRLPADFPVPVLIIQHMPASQTTRFSERINKRSALPVWEAWDGGTLIPGMVIIAPGGQQMEIVGDQGDNQIRLRNSLPDESYQPCIDVTFHSLARVFPGEVLAIVLSGMGEDGCHGARALKTTSSMVWAQDEASSVVYGMPAAIAQAGLADRVLPVDEIGDALVECVYRARC